jgi:addiction module HigA family antidote
VKRVYRSNPDYCVMPGETISEVLEAKGMKQYELAKRMGRPIEQVNRIINGRIRITVQTALQLERVLSTDASFWMNLETNYRIFLARKARK